MKTTHFSSTIHNDNNRCLPCGSASLKPLVEKQGYQYVKCRHCGFVWVIRGSGNSVSSYEGDYYFFDEGRKALDIARARQFFDLIRDSIPGNGKLLDVGCAKGFFIKVANENGCNAYGIDISETAVSYAKEELGLQNVISGKLEEANYPESHFDVITMWELIEHLYDPMPVLKTVKRILKKDGFLFLSTPNVASIYARMFGEKWHGFGKPQYHVVCFGPQTIRFLLKKVGFTPRSVQTIGPPQQPNLLADNFTEEFAPCHGIKVFGKIFRSAFFRCFRVTDGIISPLASALNVNDTMVVMAGPVNR